MISPQTAFPRNSALRRVVPAAVHLLCFLFVFLILDAPDRMKALTLTNVLDLALSDVQAAVNSASAGEVVQLPAGTAVWTSPLTINNNISLVGAGSGKTIIIDNIPSGSFNGLIQWSTISNYTECELSGIEFEDEQSHPDYIAELQLGGFCPVCRVTGCLFLNLWNPGIQFSGGTYGCVDHCQFYSTNFANDILCYNAALGGFGQDGANGYGDVSWAMPVQWGSVTNFIYIEACQFWFNISPNWPGVEDGISGTRIVFRYNTVTNMFFQTHGTESGNRERGGRAFEIYNNFFINNAPPYTNSGTALGFRSGTGVIFSNIFEGYGSPPMNLVDYRGSQAWQAFGGANGLNPWDTNGALVATGTHTGASGSYYLEDANATWSVGQWVGGYGGNTNWAYECVDVTQGGDNYTYSDATVNYGIISSNGIHDIYLTGNHVGGIVEWNNGDTYAIYKCYAQLDQPGRGSGDLIADNTLNSGMPYDTVTGKTNWPNEVLEPWYDWANTNNFGFTGFGPNIWYINNGGAEGSWPIIIDGRDYIDNTPKPGYVPLPYPHPLDTTAGSTLPTFTLTVVDGTGSGSYTNSAVVSISATAPSTVTNAAFANWAGSDVANTNSASTTVTMPASNLTVTADYTPFPPTNVNVGPGP